MIRPLSAGGRRCECRQCGQWPVAGIIAGRMYTTLQQHRATEPELEPGLQTQGGGQCVHCSMQTSGAVVTIHRPAAGVCSGCSSAGAADQWRRETAGQVHVGESKVLLSHSRTRGHHPLRSGESGRHKILQGTGYSGRVITLSRHWAYYDWWHGLQQHQSCILAAPPAPPDTYNYSH